MKKKQDLNTDRQQQKSMTQKRNKPEVYFSSLKGISFQRYQKLTFSKQYVEEPTFHSSTRYNTSTVKNLKSSYK